MKNITKRQRVWAVVVALILIMLLAIQFQPFADEVQWNETVAFGVMFLIVGGAYELWQWLKTRNKLYCFAFIMGFFGVFLLGWVSGAVGIIGSEDNSVNSMYWAVPIVGFIGSLLSRFKSHGMAYTLFVVALIQFLVPVVALIISPEVSWGNAGVVGVFIVNFIFAAIFAVSGLLFRKANI
ncbi:MAG: hypothetical protein COV29_02570 [Candidatus Yanofskybacteria bacterium CG10_big_fil_rev_8_21_14_0_10_36_16]|uniref:Uncharacterized protein n=1 Tax=Candidatus Yanofskybacteria bacterium CG10_big_fil_rev_8_21_14_0_10_36_16 TaxID=1975096 RepID=A0A2J0Q7W7_9BACT|nr:MAG: hypothetical protein COV29_02570 [Candidatus Yanofskybacteria bacterium CG10_big_fil_rev_8_21_14_0_10_36_16]